MSRVVGFSLKLEGSTATIAEINKIEKALQGISEQINSTKKLNLGVLKPLFEGQEQLSKAISETNKVLSAQSKILSNLGTSKNVDSTIVDNLQKTVTKLRSEITKLQEELKDLKTPKVAVPTPEGFDKITAETKKIIEDIKKIAPAFDQLASGTAASFLNKITDIDIKLKAVKENITKAKQAGSTDNSENLTQLVAAEKALKIEKAKTVALLKEEEKQFIATSKAIDPTSVIGMREELSRLKAEYLKLSEAERNSAEGQKKFNAIVAHNNNISTIEQSLGDFRRNVGNYRDAVNGLVPTLLNLQKQGFAANQGLLDTFKNENRSKVDALEKEINQLSAAYAKLTAEERKADVGVELLNKLNTQADELNRSLRTLPNEVSGLKKSFIGIGDIITGGLITGGILAAVSSIKAFGTESIEEFKQAEVAISKVRAQLEATGNASGKTAEELRNIAQDIEVTTGIDGDQILDQVTSKLLTFTRIQGDAFNRAQKAAVDLGQTLGGDLSSATQILGKALDNPLKGISLLGKAGIYLSDATKKQVQEAIAANDIYKAQSAILSTVETKVKGVASAINNSELSGLRRWQVDWNNFKEDFGRGLITITNQFLKFTHDLSDGVLFDTEGTKIAKRAINELSEAFVKESISINASFDALKKQNLTNEERGVVIKKVVDQYGTLITKEELELASLNDLDRIQKSLTQTVKLQVFERVKAAAEEAALTELANKKIQLALAKRRDVSELNTAQLILASVASNEQLKEFFDNREKELEKEVTDLANKSTSLGKVLTDAFPELNVPKIENTYRDAELKVEALLKRIQDNLESKTLDPIVRKKLVEINQQFVGIDIDPRAVDNVIKAVDNKNKLLDELFKKKSDVIGGDGEKVNKAVDDQIKRIEELKRKISDLSAEAIVDEFDRQIAQVKSKTAADVEEIKRKIKEIKAKPVLTTKDSEEIKLSQELIGKLGEAEQKQIEKINDNRKKALQEAKNELIKLQNEVQQIILEGTKNVTESNIDTSSFKFAQINREIEIKYNVDNTSLKEQLAKGEISEKEFKKRSNELEINKLNEQLKAAQDYSREVNLLYEAQYLAQIKILEAKKAQADVDAEIEASLKRQKLVEDSLAGKIDDKTAIKGLLAIDNQLAAQKSKNTKDYNIAVNKANQERVTNEQATADKIKEIVYALNGLTIQSTTQASEDAAEKRRQLIQGAIDLAKIASDAIFEIENNQINAIHDQRISNLERERDARLKLVKGNAAEEERINREYDIKKRKLDEENFKRQQRAAILQATINGALGATAVFAVPDFTFGIKSAIQLGIILANTIAQIAIIKSQSFAEGGFAKKEFRRPGEGGMTGASIAPKDHTGKRPVGVATYHENEYTMPDWQVEMHEELAKAMDKDRATKSNYHVNLYYRKMAMKAIENYENNPGILRRKPEPRTIPFIYQPRHIQKESSKVEMSEEVIDRIAETIATKAEQAITKGVNKGYAQSVKEITQDELRKQQRELKKAM